MMRRYFKGIFIILIIISMPTNAYAGIVQSHNNAEEHMVLSINPFSDVKRYMHKTENGLKLHRLWNATKNQFEGPWVVCDCD